MNMLSPKKTKFRKQFKGRIHGSAKGNFELNYGSYGLKALEPERITSRQLALVWGVHTIHALEPKSFSGMIENACELAKKEGIVKKGDYVVITAGAPIGVSGSTNNLRIAKIN